MDKEQVIGELQYLGVGTREYKALLMVPLVRVAWADGEMVASEKRALFTAAKELGVIEGDAGLLLDGWITNGPSEAYCHKALEVIRELAPHNIGLGTRINREDLDFVIAQCRAIGKAGTGLMGMFRTDPRIKAVLEEVEAILSPEAIDWDGIEQWEDDDYDLEEDEDSDEWDDEDYDSDEWEDDDSEEEGVVGGSMKLGVTQAKVKASTADAVKAKQKEAAKAVTSKGRRRRKAPGHGEQKQSNVASVNINPPGFDD